MWYFECTRQNRFTYWHYCIIRIVNQSAGIVLIYNISVDIDLIADLCQCHLVHYDKNDIGYLYLNVMIYSMINVVSLLPRWIILLHINDNDKYSNVV